MTRKSILRILRNGLRLALFVALLTILYFVAALFGALVPSNSDSVQPETGVTVWVRSSDIHTDIIVPVTNEVFDWSEYLSREDALAVDESYQMLALGWGDRRFYLETPTWSDVKVANVLSAFFGFDETAMHVEWLRQAPEADSRCRKLVLSEEQYRNLSVRIWDSFAKDSSDRSLVIDNPGYYDTDRFYEANGRYSAVQTCNTWVRDSMEAGGVRIGCWTPLPWGVFWQLPN